MKLFGTPIKIFACVVILTVTQTGTSRAGLLPVSAEVSMSGNVSTYSYSVAITSDSTLRTGDFFTIYDFQGMVPNSSTQPAGFAYSSSLLGSTPAGIAPQDDASVANATWTYTGQTTLAGSITLGNFTVQSQISDLGSLQFSSLSHRQVDGQADSNITSTEVPVGTAPVVPEPATLLLFGMGLPFLGLIRYMHSKK